MTITHTADLSSTPSVSDEELFSRFQPIFDDIATTAVEREQSRILPFDEVERLRAAGYGRLRLPLQYGGLGASIEQYARLQITLGSADSNLPQIFRGHFGFLETRLQQPASPTRDAWLRRIADGALIGNAQSEQGNTDRRQLGTTLRRAGDSWLLSGTKYYSTGSIFADWLVVTACLEGEAPGSVDQNNSGLATVAVDARAAGVELIDDWDGFGQRLTGSGTTRLVEVLVPNEDVQPGLGAGPGDSYLLAFFQLTLLSALAGISRAALRDCVEFTRARTRHLGSPLHDTPRQDPAVQQIVGEIAGAATAVESMVLTAAGEIDRVAALQLAGEARPADFDASDYAVFHVQSTMIDLVLRQTSRLFEVGGASAVSSRARLDRHWRNARTLGSHNPAMFRDQIAGDYLLNGTRPSHAWERLYQRPDTTER